MGHAIRRLFLQFAIGVAYWLLPRKRTPERPLGYNERLAYSAVLALNIGLALRVGGELRERTGHADDTSLIVLAIAGILQIAAAALFVIQLWPRVGPRFIRPRNNQT